MTVLALHILLKVLGDQCDFGYCQLSNYRQSIDCPRSTFYRHVNALIQCRLIARYSRDVYVIHPGFAENVWIIRNDVHEDFLPDVQMKLPF